MIRSSHRCRCSWPCKGSLAAAFPAAAATSVRPPIVDHPAAGRQRTPVMITLTASRALLSVGLAGGMLFGLFNLTITENHRTDVVQSLASGRKSFVGPVDDPFFVDL